MARSYPTTPMCDGELLARFEPTTRDSDVLISTTAKCGQTWLQAILFHLKTRGQAPDFNGLSLPRVTPWLELPGDSPIHGEPMSREERLAQLEALDDPRIFKLHVVWDEIPRPEGSAAKVTTITRDPRDVPYSMFCHLRSLRRQEQPPEDFNTYFERWFKLGLYFKFVASFWPHRHDSDVLWLRYEDVHEDSRREMKRMVEFLGWDRSKEDIDKVLPLIDFGHMQRAERTQIFAGTEKIWNERGKFFREGAVGKNRERLSASQEQRILERTRRELGDDCAAFLLRDA